MTLEVLTQNLRTVNRDLEGKHAVWKAHDKTVSRVDRCAFIGSGGVLAAHVAEKLLKDGLPTAIVHHLATQVLREVKSKGAYVGGNTDTWSVRTNEESPYFDLEFQDDRHLWGLEDILMSATRCALEGRSDAMNQRIKFIADRLNQLKNAASKPMAANDREWRTLEVCRPDTNPFRDL